ncbi:uncharacterized protein FOMMEDRAFT_155766 [Fomitiporia mediterranea MF3/22]|uniref:uncharacterized protein n=1 Tax=Fomitiporia mediterranea (strain MF3/22) TaxID=694068 RepID=UPI00044097B5|nr:uncharacterized protein FOMMEDRAFT_155766 [Fomitiporia mediterranea MF3/22]EJD04614.1 hypothetical protein FOMMEDRAFT_155766 [Fomitiporia mediterranea MF3/22]
MRVYALFGATRWMLAVFVILTLLLFGFNILQLTLNLASGFGCLDVTHVSGVGWTVTSFVELLLFLPVLYKTVCMRKFSFPIHISRDNPPKKEDIITLMARDSIVYFAVIFSICLLGAILVFISERIPKDSDASEFLSFNSNTYLTVAITIITILAPKMLINLRAEYYGPVGLIATQLSWNAQAPERSVLMTTNIIMGQSMVDDRL